MQSIHIHYEWHILLKKSSWIYLFWLLFGAQSVAMIAFYWILFLEMIAIMHSPGPLQCYNQHYIDDTNHFCRKSDERKPLRAKNAKGAIFIIIALIWQRKVQIFIWLIVVSTIMRCQTMFYHSTTIIQQYCGCWGRFWDGSCRCLRHGGASVIDRLRAGTSFFMSQA